MKPNYYQEGIAFRLRPVARGDAALILELRGDASRTTYLHPISGNTADQEAYLDRYFSLADDFYFVIERKRTHQPEGLASLYDVNIATGSAEWGRWIVRKGSQAAIESALLIYQLAFEKLRLKEVFCRTIVENQQVVSFHDSCGLQRRRVLPQVRKINDRAYDVVEHVLCEEHWPKVRERLSRLAQMVARILAATGHQGQSPKKL